MFRFKSAAFASLILLLSHPSFGQQPAATSKQPDVSTSKLFHQRASEKTGLLIPLYIYPANIHTNDDYNRVMDLKRKYPTVPFWVVINPASGPGQQVDANYTKAVDRLIGAGCVVLGYAPTNYGKLSVTEVQKDLLAWKRQYPRVHGVFFDEMIYEDTDAAVAHQCLLNATAHEMGYWPTVANPGTDTPGRYFAADAADVIVIHESNQWPTEEKLHGNYFGGYSDFPPFMRATLMYSQSKCDPASVKMACRYTRWIYVTQDNYTPNDPKHPNPWDQLSIHLESLCESLAQ